MKTLTLKFTDAEFKKLELAAEVDTFGMMNASEYCRHTVVDRVLEIRRCRKCGCTDVNCEQCVEKTGDACHWVEDDLCSACVNEPATKRARTKR
jgi:hypothetical protein